MVTQKMPTKYDWGYNSSKLICDDCGINCELFTINNEVKCLECIRYLKEEIPKRKPRATKVRKK
jgi:hypothetical protein